MISRKVRKAVIPAAGLGTRFLPATKAQPKEMLPIVDKPTIQYIVEEAVNSGIEEIIVITSSTKRSIEDHFDKSYELEDTLNKKNKKELLKIVKDISNMVNIHYIRQKEPLGLGHAVLCAQSFIGDEPFAVLLGDDIVYEGNNEPALKQLINTYKQTGASIVGVQSVDRKEVDKYGIVAPVSSANINDGTGIYKVKDLVEKPSVEDAPSELAILGRYVLTPEIFEFLKTQSRGAGNEIQLTDAIKRLNTMQAVYACDFKGIRYDVGDKFGFIKAQIDYSLRNEEISKKVEEYLKTKFSPKNSK